MYLPVFVEKDGLDVPNIFFVFVEKDVLDVPNIFFVFVELFS